jgi:hypothetical protein
MIISDKVRPYHLEHKAVLYVRQSSADQVVHKVDLVNARKLAVKRSRPSPCEAKTLFSHASILPSFERSLEALNTAMPAVSGRIGFAVFRTYGTYQTDWDVLRDVAQLAGFELTTLRVGLSLTVMAVDRPPPMMKECPLPTATRCRFYRRAFGVALG